MTMGKVEGWLRVAASLLLVAAFFVPLSRCAQAAPPLSPGVAPGPVARPDAPETYRYYYAWTDLDRDPPWAWLFLGVFFWPPLLLGIHRFGKSATLKRALLWTEPLLALGSGYWLYLRTFLREIWIGGYLAYAGLILLLAASVTHAVSALRARRRDRGNGDLRG
jgi:hypothetical protein